MPLEEAAANAGYRDAGGSGRDFKRREDKILYLAMNRLEQRKREILLMQYFGELTQKEIAAILKDTGKCEGIIVSGKA